MIFTYIATISKASNNYWLCVCAFTGNSNKYIVLPSKSMEKYGVKSNDNYERRCLNEMIGRERYRRIDSTSEMRPCLAKKTTNIGKMDIPLQESRIQQEQVENSPYKNTNWVALKRVKKQGLTVFSSPRAKPQITSPGRRRGLNTIQSSQNFNLGSRKSKHFEQRKPQNEHDRKLVQNNAFKSEYSPYQMAYHPSQQNQQQVLQQKQYQTALSHQLLPPKLATTKMRVSEQHESNNPQQKMFLATYRSQPNVHSSHQNYQPSLRIQQNPQHSNIHTNAAPEVKPLFPPQQNNRQFQQPSQIPFQQSNQPPPMNIMRNQQYPGQRTNNQRIQQKGNNQHFQQNADISIIDALKQLTPSENRMQSPSSNCFQQNKNQHMRERSLPKGFCVPQNTSQQMGQSQSSRTENQVNNSSSTSKSTSKDTLESRARISHSIFVEDDQPKNKLRKHQNSYQVTGFGQQRQAFRSPWDVKMSVSNINNGFQR